MSQAAFSMEYQAGDQPVPGYTLVRELGRGAMGVVWLARTANGIERAVKIVNLQQRGGKKEYRGLRAIKQRKIQHTHLLGLVDYWLKDRSGQFIPDSDALDNTDSFFAPTEEPGPKSWSPDTSALQGLEASDSGLGSPTRGSARPPQTPPPKPPRRLATRMLDSTTAKEMRRQARQSAGEALDAALAPSEPYRRPVQLIVAMELGQMTLADYYKRGRQGRQPGVSVEQLLRHLAQAARAIDYLHGEGLIHRDIKPQNIMLVGEVAKVCDYGLLITTDTDLRTTSNAFTPLYASPEAVAEQPLTGLSDQYSLAVTYVELRTGRTPYASETTAAVFVTKETGRYNLSRLRKRSVRQVVRRALAMSPADRFDSCGDFVHELTQAENSHVTARWIVLGVVLLAVAIAALAFVIIQRMGER